MSKLAHHFFERLYLRWREDGRDKIRMITIVSDRTLRYKMFRTNYGIFRWDPRCSVWVLSTNCLNPKLALFFIARFSGKIEEPILFLTAVIGASNHTTPFWPAGLSWAGFFIHFLAKISWNVAISLSTASSWYLSDWMFTFTARWPLEPCSTYIFFSFYVPVQSLLFISLT